VCQVRLDAKVALLGMGTSSGSSAIEDRDISHVLDLHKSLGRDAAPEAVIAQR